MGKPRKKKINHVPNNENKKRRRRQGPRRTVRITLADGSEVLQIPMKHEMEEPKRRQRCRHLPRPCKRIHLRSACCRNRKRRRCRLMTTTPSSPHESPSSRLLINKIEELASRLDDFY